MVTAFTFFWSDVTEVKRANRPKLQGLTFPAFFCLPMCLLQARQWDLLPYQSDLQCG